VTLRTKAAAPYLCFIVRPPGEQDRSLISNAMLHTVCRGLQLFWALSLSLISQFFVSTIKLTAATTTNFRFMVFTIKAHTSEEKFAVMMYFGAQGLGNVEYLFKDSIYTIHIYIYIYIKLFSL